MAAKHPLEDDGGEQHESEAPSKMAKLDGQAEDADAPSNIAQGGPVQSVDRSNLTPDQQAMPPPIAPASFLQRFQPSIRAMPPSDQSTDPAITYRIVGQAVQLFRCGRIEAAGKIAQFSIDLIGEEIYQAVLADFLSPPHADIDLAMTKEILLGAAQFIWEFDQVNGQYLATMVAEEIDFGEAKACTPAD